MSEQGQKDQFNIGCDAVGDAFQSSFGQLAAALSEAAPARELWLHHQA
jgi:hypothetical protein